MQKLVDCSERISTELDLGMPEERDELGQEISETL